MTPSTDQQVEQTKPILGLPEGVELIDFHPAGPDDFELIRMGEETHIYKGVRLGAASGVKVKAAEGFEFVQVGFEKIFDMRDYKSVDGRPEFSVARKIEPQNITVTAKFTVTNALELKALDDALAGLPKMPGFVGVERT